MGKVCEFDLCRHQIINSGLEVHPEPCLKSEHFAEDAQCQNVLQSDGL